MSRTAIDAEHDLMVKNHIIERILKFFGNDTVYYWEEEETVLHKLILN